MIQRKIILFIMIIFICLLAQYYDKYTQRTSKITTVTKNQSID